MTGSECLPDAAASGRRLGGESLAKPIPQAPSLASLVTMAGTASSAWSIPVLVAATVANDVLLVLALGLAVDPDFGVIARVGGGAVALGAVMGQLALVVLWRRRRKSRVGHVLV
ncbi:hypothetical protein GCM10009867_16350 [Pedococcus aerophilus]|uniref:Polysaccharide biosynthesis protein C-terminal domain-containing protein n=1 Tax=Pedococcus aerophilus TaxID=436356 RepID=A0ABP6H3I7_9MICO